MLAGRNRPDQFVCGPVRRRAERDESVDPTLDLDATLDYLPRLDAVRPDRVGVIGFCWGGSQSFRYATNQPALSAAVICYGGLRRPPITGSRASNLWILFGAVGDPLALLPAIRRATSEVDGTIPLASARSMERVAADSNARHRFTSLLVGLAAIVGLVLAGVGLYGVVSFVVARRKREIGTRIAIGARPAQVERQFVFLALGSAALGLLLGAVLAFFGTRALEGLLVGVAPHDPRVFLSASLLLLAVATLASWIPTHRAARIDPVETLRSQ